MAGTIYVYQCQKATCKYVEQYGKLGAYKCPKCGSSMVHKHDQDKK
jgi:predicted RNA-binding Zn-ribbon protein involved in translation (DUF1610 family)